MKNWICIFLLLNIVRCHNVSDFPFLRLKNYPKITKDKDNIHVDFELIVERNLSTRDFNAQRNSFFVFSLLYPLNLKLQHNSKLEYLGDFSKVRDSKVDDASYAALAEKVKGGGFIGKCSNYAFLDIIFNLESKLSKPIGVNDSTSLENEIKTIKSTDDLVINFYHFQDTLKLGLYTFSADFALRKDLSSTSISTYYDEFVLALGIKNHIKERAIKEMKCLTKTPITAAIMMKHFEKNSFQSAFCSYYFGYDLSEPKYELPLRNNLKIEAKFERKPSNGSQTLSLEFTADEKIKYETLYPTQFDIVIDLPKSFAGKKLDETKLCKPDCTPKLYYLTCKYEAEKGRVTYSTVKSYLENMKTLKIIMDLSGTDESLYLTHKSSEVSAHFYLKPYVASIDLENVDFNDEISSNTKYKFVADECSGVVKELFGDFYKLAHSRRYLLYGGTAKVEMNVPQTLMYAITKVDNFNVMKVYLSANAKLAGQKATLKLTAGRPDQEFFGLPTEADYDKNKLLPRNKGVTRSLNRLSVEFEYNLRLTDDDNDKFHKITIVFRSKDKHLLNLYDPDYLRFSLVGKSGNLPLNVFPKVPVALSDVYSPKSSEVKVTGPYLVRKSGLIVMQFKIKAAINNRLVVHFELDSKVKKLVGKYVSGELLNTFDGIFEVKTDGLKYVEFFFDPSYKTGTEYTFSVNLSFDTTGVNKFPYEKMTLYVDPEPLLRGGMFTPNPLSESVFTQEYSFSRINDLGASLVPCLAADTKFSSSMFRSGDNATYIFTRMFDCQKPWLGPKTSDHGDISVTVVDEEKKDGYRVTVTEPLSLAYSDRVKPAMELMKSKRFYEHLLYIFLDDTAVETIRKQMIAGEICEDNTGICKESDFMPMLENFIKGLFEEEKEMFFANTLVRFFDSKNSTFHTLKLNPYKILIREVREHKKYKSVRDAFEFSLDEAFAHSHANKMGASFSMIALVNNKFASELKADLKKFVPTTYGISVNGVYQHPVFVDIIPLDEKSKLVIGESNLLCESTQSFGKVNLKTYDDIKFEIDNEPFERPVFTGFKFTTKNDLVTINESGPSGHLKGNYSEVKLKFNRDDFKVFFGISDILPTTCLTELGQSKIPVQKALKSSVTYAKESAKSYHIIATCASFGDNEKSKAAHNYLLTFKGIVLGEYSVVAKEEVPEKLYGECDLFSLYKYMPGAPHYNEKNYLVAVPDQLKSYKVEGHVQKIESAERPVAFSEKHKKYLSYRTVQKTIGELVLDPKPLPAEKKTTKTPAKRKNTESLEQRRYKVQQYVKLMKSKNNKVKFEDFPEDIRTEYKFLLLQELLGGLDLNQVPKEKPKKK